ncbi:MAG: hypothetical protein AAF487_05765 [Bacteroidota bacterium]
MLEFSKKILRKVSFDRQLFKKELIKSFKWLNKEEIMALKVWCIAQFGSQYSDIIVEAFDSSPFMV